MKLWRQHIFQTNFFLVIYEMRIVVNHMILHTFTVEIKDKGERSLHMRLTSRLADTGEKKDRERAILDCIFRCRWQCFQKCGKFHHHSVDKCPLPLWWRSLRTFNTIPSGTLLRNHSVALQNNEKKKNKQDWPERGSKVSAMYDYGSWSFPDVWPPSSISSSFHSSLFYGGGAEGFVQDRIFTRLL